LTLGREEKVSAVLDKVAKRHNVPLTAVAIAYTMQKVGVSLPRYLSTELMLTATFFRRRIYSPFLVAARSST
jgi:hypothetical protein